MINFHFFPSKRLAVYMGKMFLARSVAVLIALVLVLQTLDLLGESGKILAIHGNGDAELWRYASLRVPQLVARFLPFSVLLGTLITLATLNQNSEIVSMKAAGISAHQIIAPLIVVSIAIAALTFVFQERVVTRATAALNAWQAVDYAAVPAASGIASDIWLRQGDDLIHVDAASGRGDATRLQGVTIYERSGGTLELVLTAPVGIRSGNGWLLRPARRFDVRSGTATTQPSLIAAKGTEPTQFTLARVDADEQGFRKLRQSIAALDDAGRPTPGLEATLWHKLAAPLSSILMPLLAAVAAFGLARSGQLFIRAVIGMALGFAYFVADNFALAMGNFGAYPPTLAAWAPFVFFLLIGETVLIRTEE